MPVYVDAPVQHPLFRMDAHTRRWGAMWSHMWCDPGEEEHLHAIAQKAGLRREYFQDNPRHPHYDLIPRKRTLALYHGAVPMEYREWLKMRAVRKAGE